MNNRKILHFVTIGLFVTYLAVLVRIVLFKQAPLYNLLSAAGSSVRTISFIPFKSLYDMAISGTSIIRIIENILGNIAIFIPFGLLLPIIKKGRSQKVILYGLAASILLEIIQYAFALGSSDIDDLLFNTSGVMIGCFLYKIIRRKSHTDILADISIIVLTTVLGTAALGILFIHHTELFMLSEKKIVVENEELVQDFIDSPPAYAGKLVGVSGKILTIEKNVNSAADVRERIDLEITPKSGIFICHNKTDYFFSTITGEYVKYEQTAYADFINEKADSFASERNNVQIWSSDGNTVDYLIIFQ